MSRRLTTGDRLTVGLSQPLRVEGGQAALSVPVGRTKGGDVVFLHTGDESRSVGPTARDFGAMDSAPGCG